MVNPDFKDLIVEFNAEGVEFLVVGAHALAAHGVVRASKDLDVWVHASEENAGRVYQALASFGAPLDELTEEDLRQPGLVYQIGVAPVRIDILTGIDGVEFEQAWPARLETRFGDVPVGVLSLEHLKQNKRATGRLQDMADLERLEELTGR